MSKQILIATIVIGLAVLSSSVFAVPTLQLYTPDGNYDTTTETWVSTESPFSLQVIGAQSPGWAETITDLILIITIPQGTYDATGYLSIDNDDWLSPILLGDGGIAPQTISEDEFPIASHGIDPEYFWIVELSDLLVGTAGIPVWDMESGDAASETGDIQEYTIVSSFSEVHFDIMGTVIGENGESKSVIAPFSHDADYLEEWDDPTDPNDPNAPPPGAIPEPATIALFGACLGGMALKARRKLRSRCDAC